MNNTFIAALVATALYAAPVAAAQLTYTFDQAFWGGIPSGTPSGPWQEGREAAVAADPDGFNYMTGSFDFDSLYGRVSNLSLTVDYGTLSHTFASADPYSDGTTVKTALTDFQIFTFGFIFNDSFGEMLTFGEDTASRYLAQLDLSFVYNKVDQTMNTSAFSGLREFEGRTIFDYCGNPYDGLPFYPCNEREIGRYGQYDPQQSFSVFNQGAAAPDMALPATVPVPAAGLMLLSALGVGAALRRRRAR